MADSWTPEQYAARLALIRKVAKKRENEKKKARKRRSVPKIDSSIDRYNINEYTDAEKYANQYYGQVAYETTRFDKDWD
jgi:hypothetical protein